MGLGVDEFTGLNWAAKRKERIHLNPFTKHPYSDRFWEKNQGDWCIPAGENIGRLYML
ncbi:MAG: hypothetical protein LBP74_05410 [Treponema sp.]|jgi:hypothetical protein|nr:hypothetical protein [Treponema sp.]